MAKGAADKNANKLPMREKSLRRTRQEEMEIGLKEIYENPEVRSENLETFNRGAGGRDWLPVVAVFFLIFLAAAAWAGFFIFRPAEKFLGTGIDFTLTVAGDLISGKEEELTIFYKNRESVPLGQVEIALAYPKEFAVTAREPETVEANTWKIGSLPKGGDGAIKVRGRVLAPKGRELTLQAYFSYRPANFNSDFQKVATAVFPVSGSILSAAIEGPEKALPDEDAIFTVRYQNSGEADIAGVEVRAEYAENFFISNAVPRPSDGEGRWVFPKLKAGQKGEIKITGKFSSGAEGERETAAAIGILSADGEWQPQERVVSTLSIVKSGLNLLILANGQPNSGAVNFGDSLRYSLIFQNKSEDALKDIVLKMNLSGSPVFSGKSPLLWETHSGDPQGKRNGSELTWSKREMPKLAKLEPGEEGRIDFSIELADSPFAKRGGDYEVQAYALAAVGFVGGVKSGRAVRSETIVSRLLSDLVFKSEARYFDDENVSIGTGPLPPRVGEETAYRVWWTVKNTLHEVEGVTVSTVLPDGVRFTNKFSTGGAGSIFYDESSRKVIWTLDKISAPLEELKADFEVAIIPAEDQVGSAVALTDIANLEGRDSALDALIFRTVAPLNTNLDDNPSLSGRGEVRR